MFHEGNDGANFLANKDACRVVFEYSGTTFPM